ANKLWNISRFVLKQVDEHQEAFQGHTADEPPDPQGEAARWIISRTDAAVAEATRLVDGYLFGEYLVALESFIWGELADFYVELAKPLLHGPHATEAVRTLAYVLDRSLRLLHPSMPFLTETIALQLWKRTGKSDSAPSLVVSPWPVAGERDLALEERFSAFIDVVRAVRNLRQEGGRDPSRRRARARPGRCEIAQGLRGSAGDAATVARAARKARLRRQSTKRSRRERKDKTEGARGSGETSGSRTKEARRLGPFRQPTPGPVPLRGQGPCPLGRGRALACRSASHH